jgi:transposase
MSETATPGKFSVEGERGSEVDERTGESPEWTGDRGGSEADATAVYDRVQAEDCPEADGCKTPGAVGALLRREGLYSSHLTTWRAARERGDLAERTVKKRGPVPRVPDPRDGRIAELERATTFWRQRAERAEALVEIQKNFAALLGVPLESGKS